MPVEEEKFEVAVIGGGPAGMMAGIKAAESGTKVVLIEKNNDLGRKLLITGKGRCNLTHYEINPKILAKAFGRQGDFLLSGLAVFGVKETIKFFTEKGLKLKKERGDRIFPSSNRAEDVLNVLFKELREREVTVRKGTEVAEFKKEKREIKNLVLVGGKKIFAQNYILATGGKSYPETGSTGSGFFWAKKLGHKIIKPKPALVPLRIKERWAKEAQGLGLKNVEIEFWQNNKKKGNYFGEALFTHFGISGPIILEMSKEIGQLLEKGEVKLFLDLKPALNPQILDERIQRDFQKYQNKMLKNSLGDLLPQKLIPVIIKLSEINPEKKVNNITKEERQILTRLLKKLEMTVENLMGFEMAIITAGGVSLKEIDAKTMKSKIIDNLYFAGEIIDLDGPSGGYNLQLCWTTGYLAGQSSSIKVKN